MKIVNSIMPMSDIEALAANGQKLRVAVTKTSAQGKAAQSATPNLMSFSTDENSIWFNRKKYGVYILDSTKELDENSTTEDIQSFLGDFTYDKWVDAVNRGNLVFIRAHDILYPVAIYSTNSGLLQIVYNFSTSAILISIAYSADKGYSYSLSETPLLSRGDVINSLNTGDPQKPLSAAMGKKLNDEISSLNTKLSSNIIVIDTNSLPEDVTTEDQVINEALGVSGIELYNAFKSGATIVDSGDNIIYPSLVEPNHIIFNVLYLLDEPTVYTKMVELEFSDTGQYSSCTVTSKEYPIPVVENSLSSNNTANALSAAQGKALNDKISALGSVYRIKGSKTNISEVLALTDAKVGDVYNVTNAFTLGGKPYPANTNVVCITATSSSDHDEGNWDPLGGTVNLSTYVPKSDIVDNLSTSDSKKPLSAKQGLALATMITELEDDKETYQLLKTLESGTLSTQSEIDAILGPYSSFNAALNAGKVIHGVYKDSINRMNTVAFSAFNDTTNSRVRMFAILNNSTLLYIQATYSGTNWTSATTSEESFSAGITIE